MQVADEGISKDRHFFFNFIGFVLVVGFQLDLNLDGARDPITQNMGSANGSMSMKTVVSSMAFCSIFRISPFLGLRGPISRNFRDPMVAPTSNRNIAISNSNFLIASLLFPEPFPDLSSLAFLSPIRNHYPDKWLPMKAPRD